MYTLKLNGKVEGKFNTIGEAFAERNKQILNILDRLYDNGEIDHDVICDWGFGLEDNTNKKFALDVGCGYVFEIK